MLAAVHEFVGTYRSRLLPLLAAGFADKSGISTKACRPAAERVLALVIIPLRKAAEVRASLMHPNTSRAPVGGSRTSKLNPRPSQLIRLGPNLSNIDPALARPIIAHTLRA